MLSSGLLYLSLVLAKGLVVSGAHLPVTPQIYLGECHEYNKPVPKINTAHYNPPTHFETFEEGIEIPSAFWGNNSQDMAVNIVQDKLGLAPGEVMYNSGYDAETAEYAYLKQAHNNIPFVNAVANLALKNGKIVSFGSSFMKPVRIASSIPGVDVSDAISTAESAMNAPYNGYPVQIEYFAKEDGSVALVHCIQIQDEDQAIWSEVYVDAHNGDVVSSTNFVAKATYRAVDIRDQSISSGLSSLNNPHDQLASPYAWHNSGKGERTDTGGNNVITYLKDRTTVKQSKAGQEFSYIHQPRLAPGSGDNPAVAAVSTFYVINSVHDITYRYGFTEKAFNFQINNFGKGGAEKDPVLLTVQAPEDFENAWFATPKDGQPGKSRFFLYRKARPYRDSALDNTIVVHEMGHGVSNRMTGGGTARCLQPLESQGLGEGWSDALSNWAIQTSVRTQDFAGAAYSMNDPKGDRKYPYSVNPSVNPLRYSDLNDMEEEHAMGEVWANMLHIVYAALVDRHGYSSSARTNPDGGEGNVVWLHLFMDSFAIQPCHPTFETARDAWLQADRNRYNGANKCLLWKAFASRGLGINAKTTKPYANGFGVPAGC